MCKISRIFWATKCGECLRNNNIVVCTKRFHTSEQGPHAQHRYSYKLGKSVRTVHGNCTTTAWCDFHGSLKIDQRLKLEMKLSSHLSNVQEDYAAGSGYVRFRSRKQKRRRVHPYAVLNLLGLIEGAFIRRSSASRRSKTRGLRSSPFRDSP